MKQIRFEKDYPKLQGLRQAYLLQVFIAKFSELSDAFKQFDTKQVDGKYYKFNMKPSDLVICLFFADTTTYKTFMTVRRHTKAKESYYRSAVGSQFEILRGGHQDDTG